MSRRYDHTSAKRQRDWRERRRADGWRHVAIWIPADQADELRKRYPGPSGGIDWPAVVDAALKKG